MKKYHFEDWLDTVSEDVLIENLPSAYKAGDRLRPSSRMMAMPYFEEHVFPDILKRTLDE